MLMTEACIISRITAKRILNEYVNQDNWKEGNEIICKILNKSKRKEKKKNRTQTRWNT